MLTLLVTPIILLVNFNEVVFGVKIKAIITPNDGNSVRPPYFPQPGYTTRFPTSTPSSPVDLPGFPTVPPPAPSSNREMITGEPLLPITSSIAADKCEEYKNGRNKRSTDITVYVYGGTQALQKEFPHMAALGYGPHFKVEWLCGGNLISDQYVLTAAHCVDSVELGEVNLVRLGTANLKSANHEDFGIIKRIRHPNYRAPIQYNDIALLRLDRKVLFSDSIYPICLQTRKQLENTNFIATGWGKTEPAGAQSPNLMKVNLKFYSNPTCNENYVLASKEYLPFGILDDSQICAGSAEEDHDTCQGDSGGPLQIRDDDGDLKLIGITSFGRGCGIANSPGVYTRVSNYISWIENIVWQ